MVQARLMIHGPDKIGIVSDLQIFHTVTSVEYPFADIMDICGKTDISKIHTLKKCAFSPKIPGTGEDEVLLWHKNKKPLFRYVSDLPGNPRNGDFYSGKKHGPR